MRICLNIDCSGLIFQVSQWALRCADFLLLESFLVVLNISSGSPFRFSSKTPIIQMGFLLWQSSTIIVFWLRLLYLIFILLVVFLSSVSLIIYLFEPILLWASYKVICILDNFVCSSISLLSSINLLHSFPAFYQFPSFSKFLILGEFAHPQTLVLSIGSLFRVRVQLPAALWLLIQGCV